MSRTGTTRRYGKASKRSKAERLFAELPQSPVRAPVINIKEDLDALTENLSAVQIDDKPDSPSKNTRQARLRKSIAVTDNLLLPPPIDEESETKGEEPSEPEDAKSASPEEHQGQIARAVVPETPHDEEEEPRTESGLKILGWDDVCPEGDRIDKIAEASSAEIYRVSNELGTSIIKVIRLSSPVKPLTKAQIKARLVDEEPQQESDIDGEVRISELLADVPGFVVYKERHVVQGKGTKELLETHQRFQRRLKRQDPGRAQFYPSPSRYVDETRFLVVELGDAGVALEDWKLTSVDQVWDILFLEAIALARAEETALFEHRDLHEGNLCIRQVRPPTTHDANVDEGRFGYSGIDITILDYGLSRAEDLSVDDAKPVAFDLEKDLSFFTSTHASQCKVYRQMRSHLLHGARECLPAEEHNTPYEVGVDGPLSWDAYRPYTNVLWLAYLYQFLVRHFAGDRKQVAGFKKETWELWKHLDPDADDDVQCFGSAADVVHFVIMAGWLSEEQLMGCGHEALLEREDTSILRKSVA